jgi:hypothetical protein
MAEHRSGRGQEGGPLAGLLGTAQLLGAAGSAIPGRAGMRAAVGDDGYDRSAGLPLAAREAAGRAGSAFTGAAGMAARAGQSAASATRDASSTLAHRMSDVSTRMAERSDRMADRPDIDPRGPAGRPGERTRRERMWDESPERSWGAPGQRSRAELDADDRTGRLGRLGARRRTAAMSAEDIAGEVDERSARMAMRGRGGQAGDAERRWERAADLGGQRWVRSGGRGRATGRDDDRDGRTHPRDRQAFWREPADESARWALPAGMTWEELSSGQSRVRGVPKRHQRRIEKAQLTADDRIERAHEASERAMQHSHSRRARRTEHKASAQADRAQRTLAEHLARAEHRMARSHQRRRRGVGMLLLAGAGAGAAVAIRRYRAQQQDAGQPAMPRDEWAGQRPTAGTPGGFPGTDRLSERMASDATAGRMEEMPGVDTMIDPSSTRRF